MNNVRFFFVQKKLAGVEIFLQVWFGVFGVGAWRGLFWAVMWGFLVVVWLFGLELNSFRKRSYSFGHFFCFS